VLDVEDASRATAILRGGWAEGAVPSLVLLDARLMRRNKRPRQQLLLGLGLCGFFLLNLVLMSTGDSRPLGLFDRVMLSYVLSCLLALQYGGFGYGWHGQHFDRLLLRARSPRALVQAQAITLSGLCGVSLAMALLIAGIFAPSLLALLSGLGVFNVGITVPLLIAQGAWRRTALELRQSAFFNYQGTSSSSFTLGAGLVILNMGLPIGLLLGLGMKPGLLIVAGLGVLGMAATPLWTRGLGTLLWRQRYAMAAGFRDTDGSE
jgi:hypothetical protein